MFEFNHLPERTAFRACKMERGWCSSYFSFRKQILKDVT